MTIDNPDQALMIAFYPVVALLALRGNLGWGVLLVAFAIPRLVQVLKIYNAPKPATAPAGFLIWPLWYVAIAFYHTRLAGGLFVLGLVINAVLGY